MADCQTSTSLFANRYPLFMGGNGDKDGEKIEPQPFPVLPVKPEDFPPDKWKDMPPKEEPKKDK